MNYLFKEIRFHFFCLRNRIKERPHTHKWRLMYRTGKASDGMTDVCSCECGTWAIRHFGSAEYNEIIRITKIPEGYQHGPE